MPSFLRYTFLLFLLLIHPSRSHIFYDEEGMNWSRDKAKQYNEGIRPGKIVVTDLNGRKWLDYASAVPIGRPGESQTRTILSCSHTYIGSTDCSSRLFYCEGDDTMHEIENVLCAQIDGRILDTRIPDAHKDIALHYLKDPVSCNPLNDISREAEPRVTFSNVSFGWSLVISQNKGVLGNFEGRTAHYSENTFEYTPAETYVHDYTADRIASLFDGDKLLANYLAQDQDITFRQEAAPFSFASQVYYHDSGSSWFTHNSAGGYSFSALSSRFTPVTPVESHAEAENMIEGLLSESAFDGWGDHFTLRIAKLRRTHAFQNILTPLALHRDWIYAHCQ